MASTPLWEWSELCEALGLADSNGPEIVGLEFDSRKVAPGDLFIALMGRSNQKKGVREETVRDGHDFLNAAVSRGASGVLVNRFSELGAVPQLVVQNTYKAMEQLGSHRRQSFAGQLVAITGSSGKTTLKSFLQAAIQNIGSVSASEGSFNNYIGVPLSLARIPRDCGYAVIEIGTNHFGEIAPLSHLANPDIAVVLNVQPAHIGNFSNLESLRREKLSISDGIRPGGTLVLPDSPEFDDYYSENRIVRFGFSDKADIQIIYENDDSIEFRQGPAKKQALSMLVPGGGRHRAETMAAAGAVLYALDLPLEALSNLHNENVPVGRGNTLRVAGVSIVDDSYNANPASMVAALGTFRKKHGVGRKFAILGDMAELGAESPRYHKSLSNEVAGLDGIYCVGIFMRHLYDAIPLTMRKGFYGQADETLIDSLKCQIREGDQILVKGSNSVFWQVGFVNDLVSELEAQ